MPNMRENPWGCSSKDPEVNWSNLSHHNAGVRDVRDHPGFKFLIFPNFFFLLNCLTCWLPLLLTIKISSEPVSMYSCCTSTKFVQEENKRCICCPYKDPWKKFWASLNHPNIKNSTLWILGILPSLQILKGNSYKWLEFPLLKSLMFLLLHNNFPFFHPGDN